MVSYFNTWVELRFCIVDLENRVDSVGRLDGGRGYFV